MPPFMAKRSFRPPPGEFLLQAPKRAVGLPVGIAPEQAEIGPAQVEAADGIVGAFERLFAAGRLAAAAGRTASDKASAAASRPAEDLVTLNDGL